MAKKTKLSDDEAFNYFDLKLGKILDKKEKSGYEGLSKAEKMIYLMIGFEGGVRNGGLSGYLGNPQGVYVEDLIAFLSEIKANAVAKDVEKLVRHIQGFYPQFPKNIYYNATLKTLPKETIEAYYHLEEEITNRLWEYESVLPLLYEYLEK